jgi:hypothetical protein
MGQKETLNGRKRSHSSSLAAKVGEWNASTLRLEKKRREEVEEEKSFLNTRRVA